MEHFIERENKPDNFNKLQIFKGTVPKVKVKFYMGGTGSGGKLKYEVGSKK